MEIDGAIVTLYFNRFMGDRVSHKTVFDFASLRCFPLCHYSPPIPAPVQTTTSRRNLCPIKYFLFPSYFSLFLPHSPAIRETFMWFLYFRLSSLGAESNKCIDVSFICRHFGDSRGLIKIGSIGWKERMLLLLLLAQLLQDCHNDSALSSVSNGDISIMIAS